MYLDKKQFWFIQRLVKIWDNNWFSSNGKSYSHGKIWDYPGILPIKKLFPLHIYHLKYAYPFHHHAWKRKSLHICTLSNYMKELIKDAIETWTHWLAFQFLIAFKSQRRHQYMKLLAFSIWFFMHFVNKENYNINAYYHNGES